MRSSAQAQDAGHADAQHLLGLIVFQWGDAGEAVRLLRGAIRADAGVPVYHSNLGHFRGAEDCLRRALALKPNLAEAQLNLAAVLEDQGRLEEAAEGLEQLLRVRPDYVQALNNLSSVLKKLGRLKEARRCLEKALALKPDFSEAHNNLGAALEQVGCWEEAASRYQTALRWQPGFVEAHMNLSMVWLLAGDFERGWKEYEWRWKKKGTAPRACGRPLWDGSPLGGRTILLGAEQGLGDTLQFIRYAAVVKQHGGQVVFECPARLAPLLRTVPGVDRLVDPGDPLPPCDVYAPLLSLQKGPAAGLAAAAVRSGLPLAAGKRGLPLVPDHASVPRAQSRRLAGSHPADRRGVAQ